MVLDLINVYNIYISFYSEEGLLRNIKNKVFVLPWGWKSVVFFVPKYTSHSRHLTSAWGSWKLSQRIPHHPKHGFWPQNHVFSMFRSWITPQVRLSLLEVILDPLQPLHPILDCQVDLRLLKMVPNDSPSPKTWGLTPEPWPWHIQKLSYSPSYSFTSWSPPLPLTAPPPHSWPSGWSEASGNGLQWFPITPKLGVWHQNHVCSMLRSWVIPQVRIPLLEVLLDLLQSLHPVLDLQINLRFFKMVSNDSPYPKSLG